jgi:transposase
MPTSEKIRLHRIQAGDAAALLELIRELQSRVAAKLGCIEVMVACCFEAGRDAFWLHRFLFPMGSPT